MQPALAAIQVAEIRSFHVGGHLQTLTGMPPRARVSTPGGPVHPIDQNGEIVTGQLYVQAVRLAAPRAACPVLLWHGGGMTGANWETTPDGREGWQSLLLRAGLSTYVSDAVERGRAGFAPWPQVFAEAPYFRTAREAWEEVFRFGPPGSWHADPAQRRPYPKLRFPVAQIEAFMAQSVPRWACNDAATQAAYDALVRTQDESIILSHSQGGNFGLHAALTAPDRLRAVISLEPSGAPDPATADASRLRGIPHLFLWGDFLDRHDFWLHSVPNIRRWHEALVAAGADSTWIDLPAQGITGNSHALMMDDNSADLLILVLDWLRSRRLLT